MLRIFWEQSHVEIISNNKCCKLFKLQVQKAWVDTTLSCQALLPVSFIFWSIWVLCLLLVTCYLLRLFNSCNVFFFGISTFCFAKCLLFTQQVIPTFISTDVWSDRSARSKYNLNTNGLFGWLVASFIVLGGSHLWLWQESLIFGVGRFCRT